MLGQAKQKEQDMLCQLLATYFTNLFTLKKKKVPELKLYTFHNAMVGMNMSNTPIKKFARKSILSDQFLFPQSCQLGSERKENELPGHLTAPET